jgi:hypothetical protein
MKHPSFCLLTLLVLLMPLLTVPQTTAIPFPNWAVPQDVTITDDAYHPANFAPRTEWWYFDASLNDNYTFQASVRITTGVHLGTVISRIDLYKDGQPLTSARIRQPIASLNASTTTPDVSINGIHIIHGTYNATKNAYDYTFILTIDNLTADLTFTGRTKAWKITRPINDNWAVMCPRADVNGTIIYRGATINVTGIGYHDHNWGLGIIKFLRFGWVWGKINSDHYTLIWSSLMPVRQVDKIIAIENTVDGNYTYIPSDQVWYHVETRAIDHLHRIPTSFFISIQNPTQMSVFHCNAISLDYTNYLGIVNYWRYHFRNTGTFTFGIQTEIVNELAIGELIVFRL